MYTHACLTEITARINPQVASLWLTQPYPQSQTWLYISQGKGKTNACVFLAGKSLQKFTVFEHLE